ncbi:uncharacterized protein F4822DRAFT_434272 [Hypoxylon trugodes]|uniref:uncharacterized protein n=1 Tax=Hypoxylon trugodes TaxID=326681 RepID=UPI0021904585|nr:uncharacterized protein F4822DRAFT_434272 [Hypoxylon trugodes]KAI1384337.1 hypothetical protein F4822DRAFT_434272 [Hypoxylon trugodes]
MRFQAPQLGALGVTFTAFRAMQFVSLVAIIGITANFINEIVSSQRDAPDVLVGTIAVASIATLYVSISYILYYDGLLPLLIAAVIDLALLVASIVVAVTIGKPLSTLKCEVLPQPASTTQTFTMSISTRDYSTAATRYHDYLALIMTDQPHCYEIKAVWGLGIALCVLFAFSAVLCVGLQRRIKATSAPPKDIEGPTALGTRALTPGPGLQWVPPPPLPTAPEPARRPPILRSIDEDIRPVQTPPVIVHANSGPTTITGQPVSSNYLPVPPAPAVVPPVATRSFDASGSPKEDFIPIAHQATIDHVNARTKTVPPPVAVVIPPTPSDDGFTPVTPTPASPRLKGFRLSRAPPLPRDALGIPIGTGKKLMRSKSRKVQICHVDDDLDDDTTPLSPTNARDLEAQMTSKPKPKRKTLWGVIEGWWDLGLLERSKSLRRKV